MGLEAEHFNLHSFGLANIEILEFVSDTNSRKEKESGWMLRLHTLYPFGLNERFGNVLVKNELDKFCVFRLFYKPHLTIVKNRSVHRSINKTYIDINSYTTNLDIMDSHPFNHNFRYFFKFIFSRNIPFLKVLLKHIIKTKFCITRYKHIVVDLIKYRLSLEVTPAPKANIQTKAYLVLPFTRVFQDLNLKAINHLIFDLYPSGLNKPCVTYKLNATMGKMIYNYRDFCTNLDLNNLNVLPCRCNEPEFSKFLHPTFKHIVTGDLSIIKNNELKLALSRGSKFRPILSVKPEFYIKKINGYLDKFMLKYSQILNVPIVAFCLWKNSFVAYIKSAIFNDKCFDSEFKYLNLKKAISHVQDFLVITTVDKAVNNFSFCCKQFYGNVIKDEVVNSSTFAPYNFSESALILRGIRANAKYKIKIDKTLHKLPFFFAITKFHKNPPKFRFISSSVSTVFKNFNLVINAFLDQLYSFVLSNTNFEVHNNLIIGSNSPILKCLKSNIFSSVITYDFSTLYTKIPLDLLLDNIKSIIEEYWPADRIFCYKNVSYITSEVLEMLEIVLNNNFIKIGNNIFRQEIGIPMGSNCAVNLANLFLFYYEKRFIDNSPQSDLYSFTYRYIDDLIAFNNNSILNDITSIYPPCMEVELSNASPFNSTHYLDLQIELNSDVNLISLYDKRRDYKFKILGFPHINSDIPYNLGKNTFMSQVLRYGRICRSNFTDFSKNLNLLIEKFISNGFNRDYIFYLLRQIFFKYPFIRYSIDKFIRA